MQTSRLQAILFTDVARHATFKLEAGPNPEPVYPKFGPYDERLGYIELPKFIESLTDKGYEVAAQARTSAGFRQLASYGLYPTYREKTRAGLAVLDRRHDLLYGVRVPERVYSSFDDIPELVYNTLLYIENRELLDPDHRYRNPAVEWDRLFRGVGDMAINMFITDEQRVAGGSTLVTQIEKYRHSPEGRTKSGREKLRQMASATLRTYLEGEKTLETRKRIVLDYVNSVPLSAAPSFGEVNGLGDGLWAWYGTGFSAVNSVLRGDPLAGSAEQIARAVAYKQVLSLFIAQRRPSYYLGGDPKPLTDLSNVYLGLLEEAGIIDSGLRQLASSVTLKFGSTDFASPRTEFLARKAANAVRTRLTSLLDMSSLYKLDRLDLTATSTLDDRYQDNVTDVLRNLSKPEVAKAAGLFGFRLLDEKNDLSRIIYSVTLIEKGDKANLVRIQTDNFDQPFNINEGVKLDLGSTAKLRTMITYLDAIATLYERFAGMTPEQITHIDIDPNDVISHWAADYLRDHPKISLTEMLEASLDRTYSANPSERFFTGGGVHTFQNFDKEDNSKVMTLRHALHFSVNLVFIRLMRDVVRYYTYQIPGSTAKLLQDTKDERRPFYLARFADREGTEFMARFYKKYLGKSTTDALQQLIGTNTKPHRVASIYRYALPDASFAEFAGYMLSQVPEAKFADAELETLFQRFAPKAFSLADQGYLAHVHPLELWVVRYLQSHPQATLGETLRASSEERQEVYQWLFKSRSKGAQDSRIRNLLEVEAFLEIHRQWQKMGYPFESLVPSYATSIGSSGDRPAALAELMGVLVNDGMYYPTVRVERLHFAPNTPYETILDRKPEAGEQVLAPEVAQVARRLIAGVVDLGTARRLHGTFVDPTTHALIPVGGKTGTGDHRYEVYGPGGKLMSSEVVNRTATFVFYIGDHFFGTLTAYVHGHEAANYKFTSALPAQLLKALAPALLPLVTSPAITPAPTKVEPGQTASADTAAQTH